MVTNAKNKTWYGRRSDGKTAQIWWDPSMGTWKIGYYGDHTKYRTADSWVTASTFNEAVHRAEEEGFFTP